MDEKKKSLPSVFRIPDISELCTEIEMPTDPREYTEAKERMEIISERLKKKEAKRLDHLRFMREHEENCRANQAKMDDIYNPLNQTYRHRKEHPEAFE